MVWVNFKINFWPLIEKEFGKEVVGKFTDAFVFRDMPFMAFGKKDEESYLCLNLATGKPSTTSRIRKAPSFELLTKLREVFPSRFEKRHQTQTSPATISGVEDAVDEPNMDTAAMCDVSQALASL